MGKYDSLREAVSGGSSDATPSTGSKYDNLRMSMGLIPDTRPRSTVNDRPVRPTRIETTSQPHINGPVEMDEQPEMDIETKARQLPVLGNVLKGLDYIAEKTEPVAKVMRDFYIPGAGLSNISGLTGAAEAGVAKVLPKLGNSLGGRVAQKALSEGIVGAPLGVAQTQMVNPDAKTKELAEGGLIGAGLGAGLGAVGKFAGAKLGDALERWRASKRPAAPTPEPDILALPQGRGEARYQDAVNRSNLSPNEEPIFASGRVKQYEPLGLPEPNIAEPTRARLEVKPNEYTRKLENLFEVANKQKFTPGRELEELESLWSQMAGPKDPALNDLIDLAYPKQIPKVNESSLSKAKTLQRSREVAGVPGRVKSLEERYQKEINQSLAPRQKFSVQGDLNTPLKQEAPTPVAESKYAPEREQILNESSEPTPQTDDHLDDVVQHAEPRIRDKVVNYLDDAEEAAKARLKAKRNTLSSNPIDQYADYAIIAAAKIGKGVVKVADLSEQLIREYGEHIRPHLKEIIKRGKEMYKQAEKQAEKEMQGLKDIDPTLLKDFSGFKYNTSDIYRNFKDVFGEKYPQVKKAILDPLDNAKLENVKMQEEWLNKLYTEVVDKLGIEKGSKLSALVQKFGEKQIDLEQLKAQAPKDWEKVVEADKFFRKSYDTLIDQVNEVRARIYPSNPDKIVPKRDDYYRHFQEFNGLTGLKNLFDSPSQIDPNLVGISEFVTPKSKFAGFMQKRGLGPFKNDAVGGFLEYLPSASYATHIDPQIDVFKRLAKNLADETQDTKNINGFIEFLQKYSQDLAGKTNSLDRAFQEYVPGGRKTMGVINWVNQRVKANTILGNVSSAVAQVANIPTGIAFGKQYAIKGAGEAIKSALKGNPNYEKSQFLRERFIGKHYRKFDTKWMSLSDPLKLKTTAGWLLETADRMGTEFIWNSAHTKAVKEGIANPVKYADDETRRLVAGRGIGEVPLMQKSKLFQTVAPFTLEVANLWRIQKDFVTQKDFVGLAMLMASSYVFNKLAEEIKGSGVVFDPIQAIVEASEEGLTPLERGGRLAGEVVSNIPLGSTLANLYPEYGANVMGVDLPTRKKLFGDNDPTRFGSGLLAVKGAQDPLYKLLPGFGGNQIKKTIEGVQAISSGGSYKEGELKYQIGDNPLKAGQSLLFGPNATKEAQTYFNKERRPLTVEETKSVDASADPKSTYEAFQLRKRADSIRASIGRVINDKTKDPKQKEKEVKELQDKLQKLLQR